MNRRHYALFASLLLAAPLQAATYRESMQEANNAINAKEHDKAIAILNGITQNKSFGNDDRLSAFGRLIDLYRNQKRWDEAIATSAKTMDVPADDARRKQLMFQLGDLNSQGGKMPAAVQVMRDLMARYPDDDETVVQAALNAANYLVRDKQHAASVEFYERAASHMDPDDLRVADVLWNHSTALWTSEQIEKSIEVARKLIDPRYRQSPRLANREPQERIINGLTKLKKPADAVAQLKEWETSDADLDQRPRWCMRGAQIARGANDGATALAAYRRLFTVHAGRPWSEGWYEAQWAIADDLNTRQELLPALKAVHLLIDAASDQGSLTNAVGRASDLLQKIDGNKKRARALIGYQLYGPAGKDGQPGNADDEKNPLDEIGYPEDAERKAAFTKAFNEVGDDAAAAFHRGQLCLYLGAPRAALGHYQDAVKRASASQWPNFASATLMNGLRGARGHGHGIDLAAKYLLEGPSAGEDPFKGIETGPSPFPALQPAAKAPAAIDTFRKTLIVVLDDPTLPVSTRQQAIRAWGRTSEAIGAYTEMDRFLAMTADSEGWIRDTATAYVVAAAREGQIHIAGVRKLLGADRLPAAAQKRADADFKQGLKNVERLLNKAVSVPKLTLPKE